MGGKVGSEDEFHETLEDITSASSSDAEEGGRRSMRAHVAGVAPATSHERPPIWTPSSFHSKFSVWKDDPSSITDRRQRLFQTWGIKNLREESNTGSATSLASKSLLPAENIRSDQLVVKLPKSVSCTTHADYDKNSSRGACDGVQKTADRNCIGSSFNNTIDSDNRRLQENSGAVLREGNSKPVPVLSRLGPVSAVICRDGSHGMTFRSSGGSPDVSPYRESSSKVLASPEGSLSPLRNGSSCTEAGDLHQVSSSQEKLPHLYDTDNGYETRSQDGYSAAEDYGMDDVLKIRDLDSGKEFLVNKLNRDGSLHMFREVHTGREITLAEFEKAVGLSPITQEMMRRQRAAESGISNEKQRSNKNSGKKKNGWLKYFGTKKSTKEKPTSGGSARSDNHSLSGEDTDGSSKGEKLSRNGSSKRGNSREGSFADPDREGSSKGGMPANDSTGPSWRQPQKVKVKLRRKSVKDLSDLHMGQEIQAHEGIIWTMKFSPDGRCLATAGQDQIIHVWAVIDHPSVSEPDSSHGQEKGNFANGALVKNSSVRAYSISDKEGSTKGGKAESIEVVEDGYTKSSKEGTNKGAKEVSHRGGKSPSQPTKAGHSDKNPLPSLFWLSEKPMCSFHGHTGDILDLSWSKSKLLLSSSMDKTVRLWHISEEECLRVFSHIDYVTCVQFNPIDDSYFLSGSLDYKLRTWSIPGHQVVDWVDLREMITAITYSPDGEKAIVGSHKGTCRFYNTGGNKLQLDASIDVRTENKKGRGKRITGVHCMPGDPQKVLVTSNDSRVRVYDGLGLCAKYKGLKNVNSQISASYTSNGDHIISASEDSRVLIWSSDNKDPSSAKSLYRRDKQLACEEFCSPAVSLAIPWPGFTTNSSYLEPGSGISPDRIDSARGASEIDPSSPGNDAGALGSERSDEKFVSSDRFLSFRDSSDRFLSFRDSSDRFLSFRDSSDRFLSFRDEVDEIDEEPDDVEEGSTRFDDVNFENQGSVSGDGEDSPPPLQSCRSFFVDSGPNGSTMRWSGEQPSAFGSPLLSGPGLMRSASLGSDDGERIVEDSSPAKATSLVSALWGVVIVTAGLDGKIRTFQNYGHPVQF